MQTLQTDSHCELGIHPSLLNVRLGWHRNSRIVRGEETLQSLVDGAARLGSQQLKLMAVVDLKRLENSRFEPEWSPNASKITWVKHERSSANDKYDLLIEAVLAAKDRMERAHPGKFDGVEVDGGRIDNIYFRQHWTAALDAKGEARRQRAEADNQASGNNWWMANHTDAYGYVIPVGV